MTERTPAIKLLLDEALQGFERDYAAHSGITVEYLHRNGRFANTCDCTDESCTGFQMSHAEDWGESPPVRSADGGQHYMCNIYAPGDSPPATETSCGLPLGHLGPHNMRPVADPDETGPVWVWLGLVRQGWAWHGEVWP
jgi:hypothetical protein